ncbi:hypothetical protein J4234_01330 [Candidatus Woesearchaeota archaeon]|nr:hypothetical protein [Candidatus Woesearchaeota archaeon]
MNLIKISTAMKMEFLDYFDVKRYQKKSLEQFVVRHYTINSQKVTIDKEK